MAASVALPMTGSVSDVYLSISERRGRYPDTIVAANIVRGTCLGEAMFCHIASLTGQKIEQSHPSRCYLRLWGQETKITWLFLPHHSAVIRQTLTQHSCLVCALSQPFLEMKTCEPTT